MRKLLQGMVLSCVLVVLTGCGGMTGHWVMGSIEPESAKANFAMAGLCLLDNGKFMACMDGGSTFDGTWTYDADTELLTFKTEDKTRSYKASLAGMNNKLLVSSATEGKDWTATMKRGKCTCQGGKCTANCGGKCCGKCAAGKRPAAKEGEEPKHKIEE